jgi:hypothetical protein
MTLMNKNSGEYVNPDLAGNFTIILNTALTHQ